MNYLFNSLALLLALSIKAQYESLPLGIDNKTTYVFTCTAYNGEVFAITQKINREAATVMPGKLGISPLLAGSYGSITWTDNSKGASITLKFKKDDSGKRIFSTETSDYFTAVVSVARGLIGGKDLVKLEIGGNYTYKPLPGIKLPGYGEVAAMINVYVNRSVTGQPIDTAWKNAFDVVMTAPDYFYPHPNGRDIYQQQKGNFRGIQYVDPKLTWNTLQREEQGDSIDMISIYAEKIPAGIPITVTIIPTHSSAWNPGPKYPKPGRAGGKFYHIYTEEDPPVSPHTSSGQSLGYLSFRCQGILFDKDFLPMEVLTQKNAKEKVNTRPGVYELKDKKVLVATDSLTRSGEQKKMTSPAHKVIIRQ